MFYAKGWDDAPHLSESVKTKLLSSYPDHQKDMRTKGIPMLGHGRIFDMDDTLVTCPAFPLPDHFYVIDGMDFGWDHPQAHVQLAWDRDANQFYVTQAWKKSRVSANDAWGACEQWARGVPTAWPSDGLNTEKGRMMPNSKRTITTKPGSPCWQSGPPGWNQQLGRAGHCRAAPVVFNRQAENLWPPA